MENKEELNKFDHESFKKLHSEFKNLQLEYKRNLGLVKAAIDEETEINYKWCEFEEKIEKLVKTENFDEIDKIIKDKYDEQLKGAHKGAHTAFQNYREVERKMEEKMEEIEQFFKNLEKN